MDYRELTSRRPFEIDEARKKIILYPEDEAIEFPLEWEVCPTCNGNGSHVNASIDSNGVPAEMFADDPDFAEDYFSGGYDVTCNECKGRRVTATSKDPQFIKAVDDFIQAEIEDYEIRRAEDGYRY